MGHHETHEEIGAEKRLSPTGRALIIAVWVALGALVAFAVARFFGYV